MVKSKAMSYEMSEKQVRGKYTPEALMASNADVLLSAVAPKFGAATIR